MVRVCFMTRQACALSLLAILISFGFGSGTSSAQADTHLTFAAYAAGLNVEAALDINPRSYRIEFVSRTAGAFGLLVHGEIRTAVAGLRTPDGVAPTRSYSYGTFRGSPRRTQIDYVAGQPDIRILEPATESDRDTVAPALWRDTIDPESAMAALIYRVNATGRCETTARTFDGRRLSDLRAVTAGTENLPVDSDAAYAGPALRCDFEGRQLAGFLHDADDAELKRVQHGSAWFASLVPGGQRVPVRITFSTRFFGSATMVLTKHD